VIRSLVLPIPAALGTVYVAQVYAIWISGGFIPPIAFANQEVAGLISFSGVYVMLGGFLASFVAYAFKVPQRPEPRPVPATLASLAALAAVYSLLVYNQPLARGIVVARGEAPVSSFIHSVVMYAGLNPHAQLGSAELNAVRDEFTRQTVYRRGMPPDITRGIPERPNVIVVFTEGMSARWMEKYGGVNHGLMPNLDRLARQSLQFTGYYNHTAATFRGLRGQLTSGHQEEDGYNPNGTGSGQRDISQDITAVSRISVPEILRAHGYRNLFFLSQQEYVNKMIEAMGFDRTLGRDYLYDTYFRKPSQTDRPVHLPDSQLFEAMLAELEAQPADKPFFAAVYNFQTHAFLDGEVKYGEGENQVLNRFHTYDRDIGRFIQRFMASPLHANTVLVFTSDHSTFPEPFAIQADERIPRYFVDTIPLMIYWKGVEHRSIDLAGKNSLDLAPSLLSLLGVRRAHNLFMGCTFFEHCALDHVSNIGSEYVLTGPDGSHPESHVPAAQQVFFQESRQAIERYKSMDLIIDAPVATATAPIDHLLAVTEAISGTFSVPQGGNLHAVGIRIGNFSGTADGSASLKVCHGYVCREATANIVGSADNDYLQFRLPAPLKVAIGDTLTFTLRRAEGTKPFAVWSYPSSAGTELTLPDATKVPRDARIALTFF
jgi:arylsulfatase A-like enzyme